MVEGKASVPAKTGTRRPWNRLDPDRFHGLVVTVVGICQMLAAFALESGSWPRVFVVLSGGSLLVSIGINLLRGRAPFESGWNETGEPGVVSAGTLAAGTLAVVAGTVLVVTS